MIDRKQMTTKPKNADIPEHPRMPELQESVSAMDLPDLKRLVRRLNIPGRSSLGAMAEHRNAILEQDPEVLVRELLPTWWQRYHNHFYGTVGIALGVAGLVWARWTPPPGATAAPQELGTSEGLISDDVATDSGDTLRRPMNVTDNDAATVTNTIDENEQSTLKDQPRYVRESSARAVYDIIATEGRAREQRNKFDALYAKAVIESPGWALVLTDDPTSDDGKAWSLQFAEIGTGVVVTTQLEKTSSSDPGLLRTGDTFRVVGSLSGEIYGGFELREAVLSPFTPQPSERELTSVVVSINSTDGGLEQFDFLTLTLRDSTGEEVARVFSDDGFEAWRGLSTVTLNITNRLPKGTRWTQTQLDAGSLIVEANSIDHIWKFELTLSFEFNYAKMVVCSYSPQLGPDSERTTLDICDLGPTAEKR